MLELVQARLLTIPESEELTVSTQNAKQGFRQGLSTRWRHIRPLFRYWLMPFVAGAVALVSLLLFFRWAPATWRRGMIENLVADLVVVAMAFAIFQVAHGIRERGRAQDEAELRLGLVLRAELLAHAQWFKQVADRMEPGIIDLKELREPSIDGWKRTVSGGDLLTDVRPETLNAIEVHYRFLAVIGRNTVGRLLKGKHASNQVAWLAAIILGGLFSLENTARLLHVRDTKDTIQRTRKEVELKLAPYTEKAWRPLPPELTQ